MFERLPVMRTHWLKFQVMTHFLSVRESQKLHPLHVQTFCFLARANQKKDGVKECKREKKSKSKNMKLEISMKMNLSVTDLRLFVLSLQGSVPVSRGSDVTAVKPNGSHVSHSDSPAPTQANGKISSEEFEHIIHSMAQVRASKRKAVIVTLAYNLLIYC